MLLSDDPRAALGRKGDKLLAHITPKEAALLKRRGGAGTRNPATGLLEFWGDSEGGGGDDGPGNGPGSANAASGAAGYGGGFGESSGPGSANAASGPAGYGQAWSEPGFFSDPLGWAANQVQQMVNNPVATLANVGLGPLGMPYASQALNSLAETIGNGIGKGVDALGISQANGPGTVGPAGSEASAGGIDPVTGQPASQAAGKSAPPPAAPAQAAAIKQAQEMQRPAAQVSRMAYGLLGDPRPNAPAAGAGAMLPPQQGGQRRGRVVVDMLPGGPTRRGLLYG